MSTLYLMNPNAEFLLNDYFLAVTIRFQPKCLLKNRKSLLGMTGLNLVAVTFNGIKKFTRAKFPDPCHTPRRRVVSPLLARSLLLFLNPSIVCFHTYYLISSDQLL